MWDVILQLFYTSHWKVLSVNGVASQMLLTLVLPWGRIERGREKVECRRQCFSNFNMKMSELGIDHSLKWWTFAFIPQHPVNVWFMHMLVAAQHTGFYWDLFTGGHWLMELFRFCIFFSKQHAKKDRPSSPCILMKLAPNSKRNQRRHSILGQCSHQLLCPRPLWSVS